MVVKGYCANICEGLTVTFNFFAAAAGVVVIVFGVMTITDPMLKPFGYPLLGYGMVAVGVLMATAALCALVGARKEELSAVKTGVIMLAVTLFLVMGVVAVSFILKGKMEKSARDAYVLLPEKKKAAVEKKFSCCGWNSAEEATKTPGCKFKIPCDKPLKKELGNAAMMRLIIPGIGLITMAAALFFASCFLRKAAKGMGPKQDKHLSLAEQAQGRTSEDIKKSKKKKEEEKRAAKEAEKAAKRAEKDARRNKGK